MSIEGQGHFFTIYFPGFVCFMLYLNKISGERLQDHWSSGYSCSTHAPIQLDLIVNYVINDDDNDDNENIRLSKLSWDNNKEGEVLEVLSSHVSSLNSVVNSIIQENLDISAGIDTFADTLYNASFSIFGNTQARARSNISR